MKRANVVLVALMVITIASAANAQVNVTVDPATMTAGYMHVWNLGGGYEFGSPWGFADLVFYFVGTELTLQPNTIGDINEYWYQCIGLPGQNPPDCGVPGAPGNKIMGANGYAEVADGSFNGQTLIFSANVVSHTLTGAHTAEAFIKVFDGGWGLISEDYVPLTTTGSFSVTAAIDAGAAVVQYGCVMTGVNVWHTDIAPFGTVVIGPELVANEDSDWGTIKSTYR